MMTRIAAVFLALSVASAEQFPPSLFKEMQWRMIGPFRGGRTVACTGVPGKPNVFYVAANNGGIWKSNDYGRVWKPIFDEQSTGSIGSLAVAPSNPNVIYAGSGEGLQRPDLSVGDGVYKSADAGQHWRHLGLRDGQQISAMVVDPHDENLVFAAVLGHPYGPNQERGLYRSKDGGESWQRVLGKDENTGAIDVALDPSNSKIVYSVLWSARQAPWEIGSSFNGPGSGLFKSMDGGTTWKPLTNGLPAIAEGLGRIGIAIAPSDPQRLYAMVDAKNGGVYRSGDGGEHWTRMNTEGRLWGRGGDFAGVRVHPRNPDIVLIANTSTYRSTDGAKTFTAIKGAPGGDDYHSIWINPENPDIILLAADQGATISVNNGETWSSWYNQPTAQFYHVITDNQFPYWVYGGQQESGSAGVSSRGDYGAITWRDWQTVGVEEYGYVAPDPLHPNLIYGGKVTMFDRTTGQVRDVGPAIGRGGKYRFLRTAPLLFSPVDPHILYLGAQVLFKTANGGNSWDIISPDLSRDSYEVPANLGIFTSADPEKGKHRGVIYTIAPSYKDVNVIWAGTDDGLIHVTRDGGKNWKNVTPPALTPWSKVSIMDASHFDTQTAYAAVNRFRLDDLRAHVYRTHDGGKTWQEVTRGLPDNAPINVVREDPVRKGLLFAGSEREVFVSFNDGDDWQSLRVNMPGISIRDLVIHNDDLVVGTHGRSFWILDDITPLRQMSTDETHLFKPQIATRIRRSVNTDTPIPPEEPMGQNPPDGAILHYYLQAAPSGPVKLEIFDKANRLVRRFASDDKPEPLDRMLNVPAYWIRQEKVLSAEPGLHRFVWDLHWPAPNVSRHEYPISAIFQDTPRGPQGPYVMPGQYTVKLTVDGKTSSQPLTVRMDPRVKTPDAALLQQYTLSAQVMSLIEKAAQPEVKARLVTLLGVLQNADFAPTTQAIASLHELTKAVGAK